VSPWRVQWGSEFVRRRGRRKISMCFFVYQSRILNDEVCERGIANNQFEFRTDFDVT